MLNYINWLMAGPSWIRYRTLVDLFGKSETDQDVLIAREQMLHEPQIQEIISELGKWPSSVLTNHKASGHLIHKLVFLADLGLTKNDPEIEEIIEQILEHQSPEGPFQVLINIPIHFGGSGVDQWTWVLTDAPLILYALLRFGLGTEPCVQKAADYLISLVSENGWRCTASPDLGKFRGPGRKEDPCPYANLIMLRALAQIPQYQNHPATQKGVESILVGWAKRKEYHPYLFYMGTDFCKLKAPLVWYDLLHVLDILSRFSWSHEDPHLKDMLAKLREKADDDGKFTPESVWLPWKTWEFSQKKSPSRWVTFLAWRILNRVECKTDFNYSV